MRETKMNKLIATTIFMAENSVCDDNELHSSTLCRRCVGRVFNDQNLVCYNCVFNSFKASTNFPAANHINSTIQLIASKQIP